MLHARLAGNLVSKLARPFLGGSARNKRAAGAGVSAAVAGWVEGNTPLAIAIGLNVGLVASLGSYAVIASVVPEPAQITATLAFVQEAPPQVPPAAAGGASVDTSVSAVAALMPTDAIQIPVISTASVAPSTFQFSAPAMPSIDAVILACLAVPD